MAKRRNARKRLRQPVWVSVDSAGWLGDVGRG